MKKARANDVQSWQRQQQAVSMPQLQQQQQQQQQPSQLQQLPQQQFANHPTWYSNPHYGQPDMSRRPDQQQQQQQQAHFPYGTPQPSQQAPQQHHAAAPGQQSMAHVQQQQPPPPQQQSTPTPASAPTPRQRKRAAPQASHQPAHAPQHQQSVLPPQPIPAAASPLPNPQTPVQAPSAPTSQPVVPAAVSGAAPPTPANNADLSPGGPPAKKSRTNTPWTPAEELRLKQMRDLGNSWAEIAKTFPSRTEGSVKKHWYKDMHYAEFAEDESQALLNAIKEYENNKWKVIGQKVGKPAKACEQYAKEHFPGTKTVPVTDSPPMPSKH